MVQNCMDEQRGRQRKRKEVDHRERTGQVQRAVRLLLAEIEPVARGIEDSSGIVRVAKAVVRA